MGKWTATQLHELSKGELIELVLQLAEKVEQLAEKVKDLQAEVARLKPPPANSGNSSQPPSRDQKVNRPEPSVAKRRGAKPGHAKLERALVEQPDQIITVRAQKCQCGADLSEAQPLQVLRRQITELPECKPIVIETRQVEVECGGCGQVQRGVLPEGLEARRQFGPRLEALVVYLQHQQHLSYERTQRLLQTVFQIDLSQGGQACIIERAGQAAQPATEAIREQVRQSATIGSDETSARVDGRNWWQWVFRGPAGVYHVIRPSRGEDVITEVMGDARAHNWVSDCWSPQLRAPAEHFQLCLAHQLRNLQRLVESCPCLRWARQMQAVLREAIHLGKRRSALTASGFQRRVSEIESKLQRLIDRPVQTPQARPLLKRYRKHRQHLLRFLHDPLVPHHNNDCERSLRASVVHRKVTGGFRSAWGAQAYAAIASVVDTAKLQNRSVFETLVNLMDKPVLPFLAFQNS